MPTRDDKEGIELEAGEGRINRGTRWVTEAFTLLPYFHACLPCPLTYHSTPHHLTLIVHSTLLDLNAQQSLICQSTACTFTFLTHRQPADHLARAEVQLRRGCVLRHPAVDVKVKVEERSGEGRVRRGEIGEGRVREREGLVRGAGGGRMMITAVKPKGRTFPLHLDDNSCLHNPIIPHSVIRPPKPQSHSDCLAIYLFTSIDQSMDPHDDSHLLYPVYPYIAQRISHVHLTLSSTQLTPVNHIVPTIHHEKRPHTSSTLQVQHEYSDALTNARTPRPAGGVTAITTAADPKLLKHWAQVGPILILISTSMLESAQDQSSRYKTNFSFNVDSIFTHGPVAMLPGPLRTPAPTTVELQPRTYAPPPATLGGLSPGLLSQQVNYRSEEPSDHGSLLSKQESIHKGKLYPRTSVKQIASIRARMSFSHPASWVGWPTESRSHAQRLRAKPGGGAVSQSQISISQPLAREPSCQSSYITRDHVTALAGVWQSTEAR